jgi:hypothetical protein
MALQLAALGREGDAVEVLVAALLGGKSAAPTGDQSHRAASEPWAAVVGYAFERLADAVEQDQGFRLQLGPLERLL